MDKTPAPSWETEGRRSLALAAGASLARGGQPRGPIWSTSGGSLPQAAATTRPRACPDDACCEDDSRASDVDGKMPFLSISDGIQGEEEARRASCRSARVGVSLTCVVTRNRDPLER